MNRFFLNGDMGALAFRKLEDDPDTINSVYQASADAAGWNLNPATNDEAGRVLDVRNMPECVCSIRKTDAGSTYSFSVIGAIDSQNVADGTWYLLDGGEYTDQTENLIFAINTRYYNYITIRVDAVDLGDLDIELLPVQYEESD